MLLTITTTHNPATDLGYLLYKNPARFQTFDLAFGEVFVYYSEATEEICSACLLLDINPISLVRGKSGFKGSEGLVDQYVNDRPYVSSSFLSVAISQVFGSALSGTCKEKPELAATPIPLTASITSLPSHGGEAMIRRLFEPLGYDIEISTCDLDESYPEWGLSPYFNVSLKKTCILRDLLSHLYVLIPVLDNQKHYWIGQDELEKLLRHGEGWLVNHPDKELITKRYLKYQRRLYDEALARLISDESAPETLSEDTTSEQIEPKRLHDERLQYIADFIAKTNAETILDLGCGEGKLLRLLIKNSRYTKITGMDVSNQALQYASDRLKLDRLSENLRNKIQLIQGSLIYRDKRLAGYDLAAIVEVIEHLDSDHLISFERVLFAYARPARIVLSTPNKEYNRIFGMPDDKLRHTDHRFEWTRDEFSAWCKNMCSEYHYSVSINPIGPCDEVAGAPTQMAYFQRNDLKS